MLGKERIALRLAIGISGAGIVDAHQARTQALPGEQLVESVAQVLAQHVLLVFPGVSATKTAAPVAAVSGQRQHGLAGKRRIAGGPGGELHKQRGHIAMIPAGPPATAHQYLYGDSPLLASRAGIAQHGVDVVAVGLPVGSAQGLEVQGQRQFQHAVVGKQGLATGVPTARVGRLGRGCGTRQQDRQQAQATIPIPGYTHVHPPVPFTGAGFPAGFPPTAPQNWSP